MYCAKCGKETSNTQNICDECLAVEESNSQVDIKKKPNKTLSKISYLLGFIACGVAIISLIIWVIAVAFRFLSLIEPVHQLFFQLMELARELHSGVVHCGFLLAIGSLVTGIIATAKKQGVLGLIMAIVSIVLLVGFGVFEEIVNYILVLIINAIV